MNNSVGDAAIVYDVHPAKPGSHLFEVTCRVNRPDPAGQEFSLPAWIPGSYLIRDYARHVISVSAVSAVSDAEAVALHKTDKHTWRAAASTGPLLIRATIYAHDVSVRGAYLDHDHAFFNGVCLFFRIHGMEEERCVVHLAEPAELGGTGPHGADQGGTARGDRRWVVATSMERLTGNDEGFGAFVALGYDDLIDHPVMMGALTQIRFDVAGKEHQVAIAGHVDADLDRLQRDMQQICAGHVEMFGGQPPFNRYVFLVTVASGSGTFGGLEHCNSSALICSNNDLPAKMRSEMTPGYRTFLGLVSHEYFHLWNVKRIRPAEFVPYPLDREAYTRQLWVFEGITSYFDDLGLLRTALISAESYLELLGQTLTRVYRSGGRRRQTLEESSFDAWIKFYKQDENAPNAIVSYYSKGAMVALALDLEVRLQTDGQCSLDEIMRVLWQNYGHDSSRGLPEDGFELLAEEVSGLNLGEFFKQGLRATVDLPVGILLAQFGIRLHMRAMESASDRGGKAGSRENRPLPWLGFQTQNAGDRVIIRYVIADSTAAKAGLSAQDEVIALNGIRVTAENWAALVDRLAINDTVALTVFRRDVLRRFELTVTQPPRDTCYLSIESDANPRAAARRLAWLGV